MHMCVVSIDGYNKQEVEDDAPTDDFNEQNHWIVRCKDFLRHFLSRNTQRANDGNQPRRVKNSTQTRAVDDSSRIRGVDVGTQTQGVYDKKWDNLHEDMHNWEPIACLSVLIYAQIMETGETIFDSPLVNLCGTKGNDKLTQTNYKFSKLAAKIKQIRNLHCHSARCEDVIMHYDENMDIILEFLNDLKLWYKEHNVSEGTTFTNYALKQIKWKYHELLKSKVNDWNDMQLGLNKQDDDCSYILITMPLQATEEQLQKLCSVPWRYVVDFDPNSKLLNSFNTFLPLQVIIDFQQDKNFGNFKLQVDQLITKEQVFWYFPLGRGVLDPTDQCSPLSDRDKYQNQVHNHLTENLRYLIEKCKSNKKRTVVMFLCFDKFAISGKHFPPFFYYYLECLYSTSVKLLKPDDVYFFTDRTSPIFTDRNIHICKINIPCLTMPFAVLCNHFYMHLGLNKQNDNCSYILITTPLQATEEQLQNLCSISWCCVVDFDLNSSKNGLLHYFTSSSGVETTVLVQGENDGYFESKVDNQLGEKVLWYLPHGSIHNGTNQCCPLNNKYEYQNQVHNHLMKKLQYLIEKCKSYQKRTVVVFLCFGEHAISGKHLPPFFYYYLERLYLKSVELLKPDDVFFFTNSIRKIPCLIMPLTILCHYFYETRSKPIDPIVLPSISGRLTFEGSRESEVCDSDVDSIRKYFEIVHIDIHKNEFKYDRTKSLEKQLMVIKRELTEEFITGSDISWLSLCLEVDIRRDITKALKDKINMAFNPTFSGDRKIELYHTSKAGASTLARRVLYDLRETFICLALLNKSLDTESIKAIFLHLSNLYKKCHCGIVLLVDRCPDCADQLFSKFENESVPIILFQVTCDNSESACKEPLSLTTQLSKVESKLLKAKYGLFLHENKNLRQTASDFFKDWKDQKPSLNLEWCWSHDAINLLLEYDDEKMVENGSEEEMVPTEETIPTKEIVPTEESAPKQPTEATDFKRDEEEMKENNSDTMKAPVESEAERFEPGSKEETVSIEETGPKKATKETSFKQDEEEMEEDTSTVKAPVESEAERFEPAGKSSDSIKKQPNSEEPKEVEPEEVQGVMPSSVDPSLDSTKEQSSSEIKEAEPVQVSGSTEYKTGPSDAAINKSNAEVEAVQVSEDKMGSCDQSSGSSEKQQNYKSTEVTPVAESEQMGAQKSTAKVFPPLQPSSFQRQDEENIVAAKADCSAEHSSEKLTPPET